MVTLLLNIQFRSIFLIYGVDRISLNLSYYLGLFESFDWSIDLPPEHLFQSPGGYVREEDNKSIRLIEVSTEHVVQEMQKPDDSV